jgi:ParB-like chromosome segregation protein Spo0J
MKWHLQKIKVSDLKEYDKNPMQHNEKDLGDLEVSINKFGVADPIRINTDFMIIGGHGTKKVLEKNGIKEVDCYLPERKLTKAEFKELNVRLNKNRSQSWDFDLLANNFELDELIDFGFEEEELTGSKDEKLKEQSEKLKFYKMVHVLVSFPPDKYLEVKELIESIKQIDGVEIEQSAN